MKNRQILISTPAPQVRNCPRWPDIAKVTRQAFAEIQGQGARVYDRNLILPRFFNLAAMREAYLEPDLTLAILAALHRMLRGERARRGHWTYDLNRHIGLSQALLAERAHMAAGTKTPP